MALKIFPFTFQFFYTENIIHKDTAGLQILFYSILFSLLKEKVDKYLIYGME